MATTTVGNNEIGDEAMQATEAQIVNQTLDEIDNIKMRQNIMIIALMGLGVFMGYMSMKILNGK
jgi:hypothetical protein